MSSLRQPRVLYKEVARMTAPGNADFDTLLPHLARQFVRSNVAVDPTQEHPAAHVRVLLKELVEFAPVIFGAGYQLVDREVASTMLSRAGRGSVADAEVVASEYVTDSVRHGTAPTEVSLGVVSVRRGLRQVGNSAIVLTVTDGGPRDESIPHVAAVESVGGDLDWEVAATEEFADFGGRGREVVSGYAPISGSIPTEQGRFAYAVLGEVPPVATADILASIPGMPRI